MSGGYSNRFQQLNTAQAEHVRQIHQNERIDMIARSKKLQQETNRRRKALVIKRKLESQREEKRRQEILQKRREQQRTATEKYQRLNKTNTEAEKGGQSPREYNDQFSPRPVSPHHHSTTPLLEEALRAVRGNSAGSGNGGGHVRRNTFDGNGSTNSSRASSASHISRVRAGSTSSTGGGSTVSGYSQRAASATNGNHYQPFTPPPTTQVLSGRTAEHARQVAVHTELHSSSLRNLTNSRSRFEAQLEQHQQNLAEHQRQALNQFNAAIRQEIDADTTLHGTGELNDGVLPAPDITRSESIDSLDSLEAAEDAPDDNSTPVVQSNSTLQPGNAKIVSDKGGNDAGVNEQRNQLRLGGDGLHASHSDSSLGNGYSSATGEQQPSRNQSSGTMSATSFSRQGPVVTNMPPGSSFMLHRSLSTGANIAVVQPISSPNNQNQTPNSVYANYQKPIATATQFTSAGVVNNGGVTSTNNYHQGGEVVKPASTSSMLQHSSVVQGKDSGLIGPISNTRVSQVSTYYVDNNNYVAPVSQNQGFYLGNYNGTAYAGGSTSKNGNSTHVQSQLTNDDFHARTKAWASPSPHLTSPLSPTGQGDAAPPASATKDMNNGLTTNTKPYSSRLTATNTTLTIASQSPTTTGQATYSQSMVNTQVDSIPNNYNLQGSSKPQYNNFTSSGYAPQGVSSLHHTTPSSPGSSTQQSLSSNNNNHQSGTVYSKGSIPSTMIVSGQPPRPYLQNPNTTIGTTPAATETTTEPGPPEDQVDCLVPDGQDTEDLAESSAGEEEQETEEEEERVIKGILKQTHNPNTQSASRGRGRGAAVRGGYTARLHAQGRGRGAQPETPPGARDSLEIARDNLGQRPTKKSVRFAEKLVEAQEAEAYYMSLMQPPTTTIETASTFVKPTVQKEKTTVKVKGKPPRPASARVSSNTPKVEVSVRESRSSSAGTLRRRPFVRHGAPKVTVSKQPPPQDANRIGTPSSTPTTAPPSMGGVPVPQKSGGDPVYDGNGLRLDRTPTDDEINWLWDKVRTCLSRNSTAGSQDSQSQTTDNGSVNGNSNGRQQATVSSKTIDGNTLAPQFRTATRVQQPGTTSMASTREPTINTNGTYYHQGARKKVSMDHLNSYGKKNPNLLSQRKSSTQVQSSQMGNTAAQGANYTTYKPIYSNQGPAPVANNQNGDVSESMAAFLTAEALAQHSMSDSQIESAMEEASHRQHHINSAKPYHKAPSAISQEEQRLLQSLERLNERLKTDSRQVYVYQNWTDGQQTVSGYRPLTENSVVGGSTYPSRPIAYNSGFRGHQPLSNSTRRHQSANANGSSVRSSHFRVGSAGNIHTNHGGHVYYHH